MPWEFAAVAQVALEHSWETMALTEVAQSGSQMHSPSASLPPHPSPDLRHTSCCALLHIQYVCFWIFPLAHILFP